MTLLQVKAGDFGSPSATNSAASAYFQVWGTKTFDIYGSVRVIADASSFATARIEIDQGRSSLDSNSSTAVGRLNIQPSATVFVNGRHDASATMSASYMTLAGDLNVQSEFFADATLSGGSSLVVKPTGNINIQASQPTGKGYVYLGGAGAINFESGASVLVSAGSSAQIYNEGGGADYSIATNANLIARASTAKVDFTNANSVYIDGLVLADGSQSAFIGTSGFANLGSAFTVDANGQLQAIATGSGGIASIDIRTNNGPITVDGDIRSIASSQANLSLENYGASGITVNGTLYAGYTFEGFDIPATTAQVSLFGSGGNIAVNGDIRSFSSNSGFIGVYGSASTSTLAINGNLDVSGSSASIDFVSGGQVLVGSTASLQAAGSGNDIQFNAGGAVDIASGASVSADSTVTIFSSDGIAIDGQITTDLLVVENGVGNLLLGGLQINRLDIRNSASGGSIIVNDPDNLQIEQASTNNGDLTVSASGDLLINGSVSAGTGTIALNAATLTQGSGSTGINGGLLDLATVNGVDLITSVDGVLISNTGSGLISIQNNQSLNVAAINADSADVFLQTGTGNLTYSGDIIATGRSVTLDAAGTIAHVGSASVFADTLNATATGGIDMFTNVSQLNVVNSGANGVFIDNIGNVNVVALNGGSGDVTLVNTGSVTNSGIIRAANGLVTVVASSPMTINAAVTAGSDIVLETIGSAADDTLTVSAIVQSATGDVYLIAGGENVNLAGATISGQHVGMAAAAGSVQATANSTIDADSLTVQAGNAINLNQASLTLHNGIPTLASQQFGDAQTLTDYAALGGTIPGSSIANAAFVAPNSISLGSVDFFGEYIYLKSDALTLNQAINTYTPGSEASPVINPDVVIQMLPFDAARSVGVEQVFPTSPLAGVTYYTAADHFSRFPGTTILAGGSLLNGSMAIGGNGAVNIGGQNFLAATTGTVTGIGNIVSTGLVGIAGVIPPPPTTTPPVTGTVTTVVQQTTTTTDPTDPTDPGGTTITEETVQTNLPTEEQTGTDTTPLEDPIDFIALLEQQPLVQGQIEVNTTVLACQ
jgi:hypothetical protein